MDRSTLLVTVVLALAVSASACSPDTPPGPPVPDSTLVDVLSDLHLAGAYRELQTDSLFITPDSILAHWNVDSSDFKRTLAYYAEHPEAYVLIYDRVLDRLSALRPVVFTSPDSANQD